MPYTRASRFPARPSRRVLITGIPPATEASKERTTRLSSASAASLVPSRAISALLAVTTCLQCCRAVSTTLCAIPSAPPINSTTTSISGSAAIAAASSYQRTAERSIPRSRRRSRAETATTTILRPARCAKRSACRSSSCKVPAPTVPRPATAIFNGDFTMVTLASTGNRFDQISAASPQRLNIQFARPRCSNRDEVGSVFEQHLGAVFRGIGARGCRLDRDPVRRDPRLRQSGGDSLGAIERSAETIQLLGGSTAGIGVTDDAYFSGILLV